MQAKVKTRGSGQTLVVSASRLADGRVVWLAADGGWSESLSESAVYLGDGAEAGMALAAAAEARQLVVGAYVVEVSVTPGGLVPLRARERYRAGGPTTLTLAAA